MIVGHLGVCQVTTVTNHWCTAILQEKKEKINFEQPQNSRSSRLTAGVEIGEPSLEESFRLILIRTDVERGGAGGGDSSVITTEALFTLVTLPWATVTRQHDINHRDTVTSLFNNNTMLLTS